MEVAHGYPVRYFHIRKGGFCVDDFELEADFEAFVEYVRELQDERERRGNVRIINPVRLAEMRAAVDALKKVICEDDSDAKISFSIDDFSNGGCITIESNDVLILRNMDKFQEAFNKLDNCEVQIANGKVQINFMAYGVTTSQLLPDEE